MGKYVVEPGAGIIVKNGKRHTAGQEIELTEKQAERLKSKVTAVEVKETEKEVKSGERELSDLSRDELKAIVDADETITVEGTGKNGAIKNEDYIRAIEESRK